MKCSETIESDDGDLYFLIRKVFILTWKDSYITYGEKKKVGIRKTSEHTLGRINVCESPQKQVSMMVHQSVDCGYCWDRCFQATSLNFCVVWIFIIGKLKSEHNRGVYFCHTPSKFLTEFLKPQFPGTEGSWDWNGP